MSTNISIADQIVGAHNQRLPLAPWHLEEGARSASDRRLRRSISRTGRGAFWGFILVVLGAAVQVEIAVQNSPYDSQWGRFGPALSAVLIFAGVICEHFFSTRASTLQDELTRRSNERLGDAEKEAAVANERAANAELALSKYRSWRRLDHVGFASVVDAMTPYSGTEFSLAFSTAEPEITDLLFQIGKALEAAGLEHRGWPQTNAVRFPTGENAVSVGIGDGVNVRDVTITWEFERGVHPPLARAGQTLANSLNSAGIVAGAYGEKPAPMTRPNPTLRVMVGRKM